MRTLSTYHNARGRQEFCYTDGEGIIISAKLNEQEIKAAVDKLARIAQAAQNVLNHCDHDCTMFQELRKALEAKP